MNQLTFPFLTLLHLPGCSLFSAVSFVLVWVGGSRGPCRNDSGSPCLPSQEWQSAGMLRCIGLVLLELTLRSSRHKARGQHRKHFYPFASLCPSQNSLNQQSIFILDPSSLDSHCAFKISLSVKLRCYFWVHLGLIFKSRVLFWPDMWNLHPIFSLLCTSESKNKQGWTFYPFVAYQG